MRRLGVASAALACAALALGAAGCKRTPDKPIAGLLAAGAPLYLETPKGERPLVVGSQLKGRDRVRASGPAVIEYFGGALRFLEDGDRLVVGETEEAKLIGSNMKSHAVTGGQLTETRPPNRIVAARYTSAQFTPDLPKGAALGQKDYLRAFFSPGGMDKLQQRTPKHEGPRRGLPPPPHRAKVPHVRADELGEGGATLAVDRAYVVAETDDLATAVLNDGLAYDLGRTVRLVLPRRGRALLTLGDGRQVELEGPADVALR